MSQDGRKTAYTALKKNVFLLEQQLNSLIQESLNREDLARTALSSGRSYARTLKHLQESVEILSLQWNFPTKNDVANVAKLAIQTEEKIDQLEEQLIRLTASIEELKQMIRQEPLAKQAALQSGKPGTEEQKIKRKAVSESTPFLSAVLKEEKQQQLQARLNVLFPDQISSNSLLLNRDVYRGGSS